MEFNLGLGLLQPSGHLDFYPHGGEWQPRCKPEKNDNLEDGYVSFFSCSHRAAYELFVESIYSDLVDPNNQWIFYECSDYDSFLKVKLDDYVNWVTAGSNLVSIQDECLTCGKDNSKCAKVGLGASKYSVRSVTGVELY